MAAARYSKRFPDPRILQLFQLRSCHIELRQAKARHHSIGPIGRKEAELYSFGPMGVGICFSRPGFFTAIAKNMTRIVLTNRQVYGVPKGPFFKDKARFQIPYDNIVSVEQFKYYLHEVLWIQYRDAEKTKEVSIICYAPNSEHSSQAYEILRTNLHKP